MPDRQEPRWLTADEQRAWLALNGLMQVLPSALDAQLQRDHGITLFEYGVLAMLSASPDRSLQMKELARLASGSLSRLSHVVGRLERRGWVTRAPAPDDGRITLATLTDDGFAALAAAAPSHVATVRELVVDQLTPGQLHQLEAIACTLGQVAAVRLQLPPAPSLGGPSGCARPPAAGPTAAAGRRRRSSPR